MRFQGVVLKGVAAAALLTLVLAGCVHARRDPWDASLDGNGLGKRLASTVGEHSLGDSTATAAAGKNSSRGAGREQWPLKTAGNDEENGNSSARSGDAFDDAIWASFEGEHIKQDLVETLLQYSR